MERRGEGRIGAPAFVAALLLSAGILLSPAIPLKELIPIALFASLLSAALSLRSGREVWGSVSTACALFFLGTGLGAFAGIEGAPIPPRLNGARAVLFGRISDDPRRTGRSLRVLAEVRRIVTDERDLSLRINVAVRWAPARGDSSIPNWEEGTLVALRGTIYATAGPRNPGEFDVGSWMRANGIDAEFAVRGIRSVVQLGDDPPGPLRRVLIRPLRRAILDGIDRHVGGEEGALLKGLLIGERSEIDAATNEAFTRAGVSHVLAVSGSNVAVLLLFLVLLLRPLRRFPALHALLLCCGSLLYMEISGAQPPVARATVMACIGIAAIYLQERVNGLNLLGLAALILLVHDPSSLLDVGFQLSFCAVASLILLTPRAERVLRRIPATTIPSRLALGALRLMAVSGIATIGTLPLTAGAFGRLSLIGLAANLVVVPATGLSVLLGALTALLQPLSDWVGSVYGAANWAVLRLTIWFTRWVATPSWASLSTHWFTPLHGAVAWSLLWTVLSIRSSGIRLALPVTLLLLSIAVWLPPDHRFSPAEGSMRVTVLDVGQGDALFIQGPTGRRILIDAGPASPYSDAARRVILPFLDRTGSRRVDALLLTHGHRDHTGGVPTLLREAEIRSIFAPPDLARRITLETGRAVTPLASGERIDIGRGARCYGLAPGGEREAEGNASSVVVKLLTPHGSWLLAGDASLDVEERLIRRYGRFLSASVLKVGHHGSGGSTGDGFIDAVSPSIAIISVGKNNPFAHPSPQVLRRLRSRRIAVLRTDCEGAAVTEDRSLASPDGSGYVLSWR